MTFFRPTFRHPELPPNAAGYHRREYEGGISTLCAGCGHDSICNAIIQACFELALPPHRIVKMSGIGCSSKTPAYFWADRTASTRCMAACPPSPPGPTWPIAT